MGKKLEVRSDAEIESTIAVLNRAAQRLTSLLVEMKSRNMKNAVLCWAQRQWTALDIIAELGKDTEVMTEVQLTAFDQGRKSKYQETMERTARDTAKKMKSKPKPDSGSAPRRAGRPRKGAST